MYDLIKGIFLEKQRIEFNVINNSKFESKIVKDLYSKDRDYCKICTAINNLNLKITQKHAYIENSIHSYFNSISTDKAHNSNDFSFCDLKHTLNTLEKELNYPLKDIRLQKIEFGFNIDLGFNPTDFLENNLLMYKLKSPCIDPKNNVNMKFKKFKYQNYEVKVYNKSLDCVGICDNPNILRVEIRYLTCKEFNKFGIHNLADLKDINCLNLIFQDLLDKFNHLVIVDRYDGNADMSTKNRQLMIKYTNPNFWIDIKKNCHPNTCRNHRDDFFQLIEKNKLDTWKNTLRDLIIDKFRMLSELAF